MNKAISTILEKDEVEFEQNKIERYMRWCMSISRQYDIPLQSIMANASISKYYMCEFSKLEVKFLDLVNGKTKFLNKEKMNEFYEIIVVDVFKNYPMPLIAEAKKLKIINPPFYAN